ncbi:MAG: hypothetical protein PHE11_06480 [Candidatus Omnitrophica bacterium]|nr:hypothetical protein [Candidatus Omnitrophota bacterium]MDD5527028.1 hypothetical protein [Candidatus Omnitrophota bacterium]
MPQSNETTTTRTNDASILDRATVVSIRIGRLGIRRKVNSDRVRIRETMQQQASGENAKEPDADMIAVSKEILSCDEYDAITSLDSEVRADVNKLALPFKLRAGAYLVADGVLDRVDGMLDEYQERRRHLVDSFLRVYSIAREEARTRLGDLYEPGDYPHVDDVREAFHVRIRFESWGAPQRLETLSQRIYQREREQTARDLQDASREIRDGMRAALAGLVGHLVDVLQPGPDGKPKTFRNSTIDNIVGFLDTFSARNVVGDDELGRIVADARAVLDGADPQSIRKAPMIQQMVRDGMTQVRQRLEQLTETRGRRFRLESPDATPPAAPGSFAETPTPAQ